MKASIFSDLTDEELNSLYNDFATKYGKDLRDETRQMEERKLTGLAAARYTDKEMQEQEKLHVRECLKEVLFRALKELALIMYLAMDKCGDFGLFGKKRISISFFRKVLDIPNDRYVTWYDDIRFRQILDECDKRNGRKSGDDYLEYCKNFSMEIFGKQYQATELDEVNELFELLDADYYLWLTTTRHCVIRFVFGLLEKREIEGNKIWIMQKEFIRSPQLILNIAAEVYKDSSIIRWDACEVIFFNKWQEFFNQSVIENKHALRHIYSSIREGFKKFTLFYSGATNTQEIIKIKDAFILDKLIDGICYHEWGHHISHKDMESVYYDFHWIFTESDNLGHVLAEVLADWAPQRGQKKGAFSRFVELSETDIKQATANVYMYMSDNWFVEEDEELQSLASDVLVSLALSYINPDSTVNFDRLAREINQIYTFFLERHKHLIDKLLAVIRNSYYDFGIKKQDYADLEQRIFEMYQNTRNAKPLEELRHADFFWGNVVGFLEKFSTDGWEQYQKVLAEEAYSLKLTLLEMITNGNGRKYNHSLRTYITERSKEIGIIRKWPDINIPLMIRRICKRNAKDKQIKRRMV
jgi:hypothetical protein